MASFSFGNCSIVVLISERDGTHAKGTRSTCPKSSSHQVSFQQVERSGGSCAKSFMTLTQIDRQTDRQTGRQADRQTETDSEREENGCDHVRLLNGQYGPQFPAD